MNRNTTCLVGVTLNGPNCRLSIRRHSNMKMEYESAAWCSTISPMSICPCITSENAAP